MYMSPSLTVGDSFWGRPAAEVEVALRGCAFLFFACVCRSDTVRGCTPISSSKRTNKRSRGVALPRVLPVCVIVCVCANLFKQTHKQALTRVCSSEDAACVCK